MINVMLPTCNRLMFGGTGGMSGRQGWDQRRQQCLHRTAESKVVVLEG